MRVRSALLYSVLRLLAFLVPFGLLMLFPVFQELPWLAAVFAALIGLSLSVLFLRAPLAKATAGLGQRTERRRDDASRVDTDLEDAANDVARGASSDADQPTKAQSNKAE